MNILVLNAGSSSLKFGLFDADSPEAQTSGEVDWHGRDDTSELVVKTRGGDDRRSPCHAKDHGSAAVVVLEALASNGWDTSTIAAVGHRVVHGGPNFRESVRLDRGVIDAIARLEELAPLHNPQAVAVIEATVEALPDVPQVAVFDTTFYAGMPRSAAVYPLPYEWHEDWAVRKYGFHGISHAYCAGRAAELLGRDPAGLRLISCHLGNGCSATAVLGGRALDTTMGFTPLDGLMMGTRSGSVDPGLLLHLLQRRGFHADQLDDALNHRSGLLGVSGVSSDYRKVESAARQGNDRARLALEIYAARVRSAIGALAATLGGADALIFTAGVGENSAPLRASACDGLAFLGIRLDPARNAEGPTDRDIAAADSPTRILVLHTREELMIARETRRVGLAH